MPQLTLTNNLSKIWNRVPVILEDENFTDDTGGFTGTNATITKASGGLNVESTSTGGYAYKEYSCIPNTTFTYTIDLASGGIGGGHIGFGTSAGNTSLVNQDVTTVATYTGSFTVGDTQTALFLSLITDNNSITLRWDNIRIQEDN